MDIAALPRVLLAKQEDIGILPWQYKDICGNLVPAQVQLPPVGQIGLPTPFAFPDEPGLSPMIVQEGSQLAFLVEKDQLGTKTFKATIGTEAEPWVTPAKVTEQIPVYFALDVPVNYLNVSFDSEVAPLLPHYELEVIVRSVGTTDYLKIRYLAERKTTDDSRVIGLLTFWLETSTGIVVDAHTLDWMSFDFPDLRGIYLYFNAKDFEVRYFGNGRYLIPWTVGANIEITLKVSPSVRNLFDLYGSLRVVHSMPD